MKRRPEQKKLADYLERRKLKHTKQREAILDVFLKATGHITGEALYQRVRKSHPQIGYTTVHRTMKLLCDAGLASERHFEGGVTSYEIEHAHHDHIICVRCNKIVEFECEAIEQLQDEIVAREGFKLLHHRHELYGLCPECQKRG